MAEDKGKNGKSVGDSQKISKENLPFNKDVVKSGAKRPFSKESRNRFRENVENKKKRVDVVKKPDGKNVVKGPLNEKPGRSLPPHNYEARFREENILEKEKAEENAFVVKHEPVNPFKAVSSESESVPGVLDNKPLDKVGGKIVEEKVPAGVSEKKMPDDAGEAKESVVAGVEGEGEGDKDETVTGPKDDNTDKVVVAVEEEEAAAENEAITAEVVEPPKVVEKEPVIEKVPPSVSENDDVSSEFWEILAQAGITKKKLLYFLLIIVAGVFAFFYFFVWGGDEVEEVKDVPEVVEEEVSPEDNVSTSSESFSVASSYILGLEYADIGVPDSDVDYLSVGNMVGIDSAFLLGGIPESFEVALVYFVDVIRRMDGMYYTDIYALLDMSVDRRQALDQHLLEMSELINEANLAYEQVLTTMTRLESEYKLVAEERDYKEGEFFSFLEALYGKSAYDSLEQFISLEQDSAKIKGYYNAYKLLSDMYVLYLGALGPRYDDIFANTEALIKGIRVFDIPSSDIEAIIPLSGE
jgi:hypothetical protein